MLTRIRPLTVVLVATLLVSCGRDNDLQPVARIAEGGAGVGALAPPYPIGQPQESVPPPEDGMVPVVSSIDTELPVVFLTIDDGAVRPPEAPRLLIESGVPATLFLNDAFIEGHEDYFRQIQQEAGAAIENHTTNHLNLKGKPYEVQRDEICGASDAFAREFGHRPVYLRPPFGSYDLTTRVVAAQCGMRALVTWIATVNDGEVQFQVGDRLRPGDIVLMHFRDTFEEDFNAFLDEAERAGLVPVPLADFLA